MLEKSSGLQTWPACQTTSIFNFNDWRHRAYISRKAKKTFRSFQSYLVIFIQLCVLIRRGSSQAFRAVSGSASSSSSSAKNSHNKNWKKEPKKLLINLAMMRVARPHQPTLSMLHLNSNHIFVSPHGCQNTQHMTTRKHNVTTNQWIKYWKNIWSLAPPHSLRLPEWLAHIYPFHVKTAR